MSNRNETSSDASTRLPELQQLELLDAWRTGRTAARDELLRRLYPIVSRFFRRYAPRDIDDLVQNTMMALVRRLPTLESDAPVAAVARGFARVEWLRALRSRDRMRKVETILDHTAIDFEQATADLEAELLAQEVRAAVREAIGTLANEQREIVVNHYFDGLPLRSISEQADVPIGTLKSRLFRARNSLQHRLDRRTRAASTERSWFGNSWQAVTE